MKNKKIILGIFFILISFFVGQRLFKTINFNSKFKVGQPIDSFNRVIVYFNGGVGNVIGRNTTNDGYNLGMKYQCVEFVKRYYYEYFNHKMPDNYGNAKDFFDKSIGDSILNPKRNLIQFCNGSISCPRVNDLIIFDGSMYNKYGHVAIISKVNFDKIEIIQQNPGPYGKSRVNIQLEQVEHKWKLKNDKVLGWLRYK